MAARLRAPSTPTALAAVLLLPNASLQAKPRPARRPAQAARKYGPRQSEARHRFVDRRQRRRALALVTGASGKKSILTAGRRVYARSHRKMLPTRRKLEGDGIVEIGLFRTAKGYKAEAVKVLGDLYGWQSGLDVALQAHQSIEPGHPPGLRRGFVLFCGCRPVWKSKFYSASRHRRDACSMAWPCRFLTARRSQRGHVIAENGLSEELSGAPDTLVDFHTGAASADKPVAEDKGFAIAPWTAVRFDNKKTLFLSDGDGHGRVLLHWY